MKKTIEIIIINYNSILWLQKTLDSLYSFFVPYSKYKIIITVVDNASTDNSIEILEKNYKQINLIKSEKNLGFFLTFNNQKEKPKVYILSNGKIDKACHRGEPSLFDCALYFAGFEKLFPKVQFFTKYHLLNKDLQTIHQVDAVSGACMITKLEYLKKVDFFDERFFMYSEDMDLCRKIRELGLKIVYNPTIEIIHHKYKSGLNSNDIKTKKKISKYFYNSFLIYYDKWYRNRWYYKILRPFILLFVKTI